jgi:O-succinylbenzoic acid--CoA ligase
MQAPSAFELFTPTRRAAQRDPAGLALRFHDLVWSHAELEARILDSASRLHAWGVGRGDVVALWGGNSPDWVVAFHAVVRLGAIALPLSPRWTDPELADGLLRAEARHLLADRAWLPRARALCPRVLALDMLANASAGPSTLPNVWQNKTPVCHGITPDGQSQTPDRQSNTPVCQGETVAPSADAMVRLLTSGTSGRPKVVELSHQALFASAHAVSSALALGPTDRWWAAMPLFHVGGLGVLLRAPLAGAGILLATRFEAGLIRDPDLGATVASFVPTMLEAVLEQGPLPATLRAAMLGGAPVPPALVARCPVALPTYGLTEAASTLTLAPLDPHPLARVGAGRPLPGIRLRVLAENGVEVAAGTVGRIQVGGATLMTGYVGDPAATANALVEGWLETGDFGHLDEALRLHVAGRREDLIVSGGENIYPAEIEAVLAEHPGVAHVAVVGVPHPRWGHAPFAFVVPREGIGCDTEAIRGFLDARLARFKQPCVYKFIGAMPLLATGKPDRRLLKQKAEQWGLEVE